MCTLQGLCEPCLPRQRGLRTFDEAASQLAAGVPLPDLLLLPTAVEEHDRVQPVQRHDVRLARQALQCQGTSVHALLCDELPKLVFAGPGLFCSLPWHTLFAVSTR